MHLTTGTSGDAFVMVYIALPASLSEIETVPAANTLPGFTVVAENAENVPMPATVPIAPTNSRVKSVFRPRLMRWILSIPDLLGAFPRPWAVARFGQGQTSVVGRRSLSALQGISG